MLDGLHSHRTGPASDPASAHATALPQDRHIALVGFMGAGKSTVGHVLASRLERPFVDLDEHIAERSGACIAEIFQAHGEVGFRARERAALRELLNRPEPLVVATGGGTFADHTMRQWLREGAYTIYLEATPDVLAVRLTQNQERQKRPLLQGPDPLATVRRLLSERRSAYEQSDVTVGTDLASPEQVVDEVLRALRGATIPKPGRKSGAAKRRGDASAGQAQNASRPQTSKATAASSAPKAPARRVLAQDMPANDGAPLLHITSRAGSYPVELRADSGPWLADAIASTTAGKRLACITDANVASHHVGPLMEALSQHSKEPSLLKVPTGEHAKRLEQAAELYDALLDAGLTRADAVVAIGGGVVGDLAGFVASTFLRGIGFVQVPTTTLAAVDASVGGKTAVNLPRGKNLVGTFYPPRAVLIAASHLATQQRRAHAACLAEALKMAFALDAQLFDEMASSGADLLAFNAERLLPILSKAIALKAAVVSRDEREAGERAVLNYGHTVGHAIEAGANFSIPHGEAVALGMLAEAEWAEAEGLAAGTSAVLRSALAALDLPSDWDQKPLDLEAVRFDKKRSAGELRLPVVTTAGEYFFHAASVDALSDFLRRRTQQ